MDGIVRAAVSLGSNLGDRAAHLDYGVARLREVLANLTVSPYIETAALGVGDQPPFLNAAAVGDSRGSAPDLLALLMAIEADGGRERPFPGAARTLDLDLILFGDRIVAEPHLQVPHPRFRERWFVLAPLAAVAPEMVDPVTGLRIDELLRRVRR